MIYAGLFCKIKKFLIINSPIAARMEMVISKLITIAFRSRPLVTFGKIENGMKCPKEIRIIKRKAKSRHRMPRI